MCSAADGDPAGPFNKIAEVRVTGQPYTFIDTGGDSFLADGNTSPGPVGR